LWQNLGNGPFGLLVGMGITSIQAGSKIILAGGTIAEVPNNDVWMASWSGATSGLAWYLLTNAAAWSARQATLASTVDDIIILINGVGNPTAVEDPTNNDVWASQDGGFTWIPLAAPDSFSARQGAGLVSVLFELALFGGTTVPGSTFVNDVWVAWSI